ncbi:biotin carboxylase N-terminal domain-containing protein [Streptomyces sp. YIM 130001]|uniref:ATP-binding protein n=1 Tax=Streptomyces sp. YIM 130001 TaxID=2259644 RepID=UPI000E65590B|nr:biotin carboxylase N-terminal domain-containing protein [Streptomyces sp. YIM 130001]
MHTIRTVLVANRGEIACRVFRTCRELGIGTAAVYSDADADALHVREADTAVRLPGSAPGDTYLRGDLLVEAALAVGADAVHPGYGFLSENAEFARAVLDAGLVWIGPPPAAIDSMAYKTEAKRIMRAAGLPLFDALDPEAVTADDLPVLVKASAGGGGRGMRIVRELDALEGQLKAASAEAESAFGDGQVFVEPYVERGRHVEVQVLADRYGGIWTLGTRDCSLQRRHQKVVEEAHAPGLGARLEREVERAATAAARAIDYVGAGTVEFLVSGERAYFLEMNTRLQVEHPVTEAVFDLDLVRWQLRVAEGAPLPEASPVPRAHAIEARLYAEDPARGWAPQAGTLHRLDVPTGRDVWVDTGYADGDEIGVHYDPMLAKVIARGATRADAARGLAATLERTVIHGPVTNRDLLVRTLRHPAFLAGDVHTGFYDDHLDALTAAADDGFARHAALAAALADGHGRSRLGGWRNLPSVPQAKRYRGEPDGIEFEVRYRITRDGLRLPDEGDGREDVRGAPREVRLVRAERDRTVLEVDGVRHEFGVVRHGDRVYVDTATRAWTFTALPRFPDPVEQRAPGSLLAPMPGTVVRVADGLAAGDAVRAGAPLLWLEAMKMEHRIVAPVTGTLTALHAAPGRQVEVGTLLAVVQPADEAGDGPPNR